LHGARQEQALREIGLLTDLRHLRSSQHMPARQAASRDARDDRRKQTGLFSVALISFNEPGDNSIMMAP
jgi:hypothetical protein